jgi:hypothetical protein
VIVKKSQELKQYSVLMLIKEQAMAYTVLGERETKWQPRKGLEGPFYFATGRVLYYDVKAGEYYDPTTDFYVPQEDMDFLHAEMARMLSR